MEALNNFFIVRLFLWALLAITVGVPAWGILWALYKHDLHRDLRPDRG